MTGDHEKLAELSAIVNAVRDRVRSRYPEAAADASDASGQKIRIAVADLMPVVHARDAAQARVASIGSVNPRPGGLKNSVIQAFKKSIARAFQWFVRGQVAFNQESLAATEAVLEALNEHNRILLSLAGQTDEQILSVHKELAALNLQIDARAAELASQWQQRIAAVDALKAEAAELKDVRTHWIEWRRGWEERLSTNEIQFLRAAADLQGSFQHRVGQLEANFRDIVKAQHGDYLGALDRTTLGIQKQLFEDFTRVRADYDRMIHTELRLIRQRLNATAVTGAGSATAPVPVAAAIPNLDYTRFAERFRGSEDYVKGNQEIYRAYFEGRENVLDIGCGRGEFLEMMQGMNVPAQGIDLGEESVAQCRTKGLNAEVADLFEFLPTQPEEEFDGIFCSQVVEHLQPETLPAMVALCASRLRPGGILAFETPNPECLAIFATHFYLDPTHTRPVPHELLAFYMEEAGLGGIQMHRLSPPIDTIPELAELPENFRRRFFGSLDYAIIARRL
ncbi:MAG: Methyltransferase type 11 [Bryobacterales bacterium]|nr:Methyltransferase type 11 [Bryobacterales bacterium]